MVRCLKALLYVGMAASLHAADPTLTLERAARRAEASGDTLNAFLLYGRAAAASPANATLAVQSKILGARLLQGAATSNGGLATGDLADRAADRVLTERISPSEALEGEAALPPVRLKPSTERKSFDLRGTTALLLEQVVSAYGIEVKPEDDLKQGGPTITFRVTDLSRDEAFHALEIATNTFFVPVRDNQVLAFRDSSDKRTTNAPEMEIGRAHV